MSNASDFIIKNGVLTKYVPNTADTKVTIPEEVHTIGANAFKGCEQLTEIVIPESVKVVDALAFDGCTGLREMVMPESITKIAFGAFFNCRQLRRLQLPAGIQTVKAGAFGASADMIVADPRFSMFKYAFYGCINLQEVVAQGIKEIDASFVPMNTWGGQTLEVPAYVMPALDLMQVKNTRIKQALVLGYLQDTEKYSDHETYRKLVCGQKNAMLPTFFKTDNVAAITILAEEKKMTAKNFEAEYWNPASEANATQIKAYLLSWKDQTAGKKPSKETLKLETTEKAIPLSALKKVWGWEDAEEGCVTICHYKGKDVDIVIPAMIKDLRVTAVGKSCFSSAQRRITPERDEFFQQQLQSVEVTPGIASIDEYAFASCEMLHAASLSETVSEICAYAFHFCKNLTQISGTENVKRIGRCAFELCRKLSGDLNLKNVAIVEGFAFNSCEGELNLHFSNTVSYIDSYAFSNCAHVTICAPSGSYTETYAKEHNIPFVAE